MHHVSRLDRIQEDIRNWSRGATLSVLDGKTLPLDYIEDFGACGLLCAPRS